MRTLTQPVHVAVGLDDRGVYGVELAPPGVPPVLVSDEDAGDLADAIVEAGDRARALNDPHAGDRLDEARDALRSTR